MTTQDRPAGKRPQTFPRKEQPVASTINPADRSEKQWRQFRLAVQAALAAPGGLTLRINPFLSLFAASLIALAPVHALAQDPNDDASVRGRARTEYDPMGMRFGGFDLHATLDLAATHTDNLFAEETGEDEDTIFAVSPSARLASHWSRHALAVDAGATFTSHEDFSSEDVDTGYAGLYGRLDIGASSSLAGNARIAHEVEPRTDPDAPLTGDPVEYDRTDVSLTAQHTFNRFRVTGIAGRSDYEYDGAQVFRNFDQTGLTGRIEAEISPRIGLLLEATTDERDYDNTPALNSEGQTYLVGATINFTDLLRGQVAVGQFNRDYDSGISTDGTAVRANLDWYITRLTTIIFNARRNSEDVVGATVALPYTETEYGVRVDHELMRNVILTAGVQTGQREYEVIDRDDDFTYADVGADWFLNRRVAIRGRYRHSEVQSDGVNRYRDYEMNEFTIGVALRL